MVLILTGQPGSGKTTIAKGIIRNKENTIILDGDLLRIMFNNFDYNKDGRYANFKNLFMLLDFFNNEGYNVIISMVLPFRELRDKIKAKYNTIEVYLKTNEIRGRENYHVDNYEVPINNFIMIDTTNISVDEVINLIPF